MRGTRTRFSLKFKNEVLLVINRNSGLVVLSFKLNCKGHHLSPALSLGYLLIVKHHCLQVQATEASTGTLSRGTQWLTKPGEGGGGSFEGTGAW